MKNSLIILSLFVFTNKADSQNWAPIGNNIIYGQEPRTLYADSLDNYLYVGGLFYMEADGKVMKGIARWDGMQWDSMGGGIDPLDTLNPWPQGNVSAITRYNGDIHISGSFSSLGNIPARRIGRWNGSAWDSIPISPMVPYDASIVTLKVIGSELYAGGSFDTLAGLDCNGLAKWNGSSWSKVHDFPIMDFHHIFAIEEYQGQLYVGGNFFPLDANDSLQDIIRWDGNSWRSVGGGMKGSIGGIYKMIKFKNHLYIGGDFSSAAGNVSNAIQRWNGNEWKDIGGEGLIMPFNYPGSVRDMDLHNNTLFVSGAFVEASGTPMEHIALWDGSKWCGLGSTYDNILGPTSFYHDTLIISGHFYTIDGDSITFLAKWLGGNYIDNCGPPISISTAKPTPSLNLSPNPTSSITHLHFHSSLPGNGIIEIYSILGEAVLQIPVSIHAGENKIELNLETLPLGMYLIRLEAGEEVYFGKVVKE